MTTDSPIFSPGVFPEPASGKDRFLVGIVFDRPDPEGSDPEVDLTAVSAATAVYCDAMKALLGVTSDGDVLVVGQVVNVETFGSAAETLAEVRAEGVASTPDDGPTE